MFGIIDYGAFAAAFVLLLFLPGPGNLALITSTGKGGLSGGIASVLGLMLGDQVLLWMTVAGVAAVLSTTTMLFQLLQWMGAAYLAWLGFKMLTSKEGDEPILSMQTGHYFKQTFLITLLNPKAIFFYVAFFPQFIDPKVPASLLTFVVMAATIAGLGFVYCMGVVLVTHFMAERLRANPRLTGGLQKLAGATLVGFGIKLALSK